mmetsp:Transcript_74327/g.170446  ORF Transcript_74327/g.170446 Transcript_74327/m.170446 type:complete len:95 (+) Transcript_74327:131-415(+)
MMTTENRSVHTLQKRNGEETGWHVFFIYYSEGRGLACWSSVNKQGAVYWTKKVMYTGPRRKNATFLLLYYKQLAEFLRSKKRMAEFLRSKKRMP